MLGQGKSHNMDYALNNCQFPLLVRVSLMCRWVLNVFRLYQSDVEPWIFILHHVTRATKSLIVIAIPHIN